MSMTITDTLTLDKVKLHLQVDVGDVDQDTMIESYISNSLAYVTTYCNKTFEKYDLTESFLIWDNDLIFLDWQTEVRDAVVEYTDTLGATKSISVTVYSNNIIREIIPTDYNGGNITVIYTPWIDTAQVPVSHQARLLICGDWFISRENNIMGTQVNELSNTGVNSLLNSIKLGIM